MRTGADVREFLIAQGNKGAEQVAGAAERDPALIAVLLTSLEDPAKRLKNAAIKSLWLVSEKDPAQLYHHFQRFARLLKSEDKILKWNATRILANLARVDEHDRLNARFLSGYLGLLADDCMITAANAAGAAGKLALAKPRLAARVADALTNIDQVKRNPECRNILCGIALESLEEFLHVLADRGAARAFAARHRHNSRPATRKKAERLLRKTAPAPGSELEQQELLVKIRK